MSLKIRFNYLKNFSVVIAKIGKKLSDSHPPMTYNRGPGCQSPLAIIFNQRWNNQNLPLFSIGTAESRIYA